MNGATVAVWSLAAAMFFGYLTLSLAARNNDPPWFAFATGALILLGGILFAVAVET